MRELEDRQKSRATRLKRDTLDRALLDLAAFYRDVLAVQVGAEVELANSGHERDVHRLAGSSRPEDTVRRIQAIMACRERLELSVAPLLAVEEMARPHPRRLLNSGALVRTYAGAVGMMMAVSFERYGRLYYLDPGPSRPPWATRCWCPPTPARRWPMCIWAPQWVDDDIAGLPVCAGSPPTSTWPGTSTTAASAPRPGSPPGGWSASTGCR